MEKKLILGCLFIGLPLLFVIGLLTLSLAKRQGQVELKGLQKAVQVQFDAYSNASIFARNKADAYYALGYITANERMFQMDMMRRKAAGRLSEVVGAQAITIDKHHRLLAFKAIAQNIIVNLPAAQRRILQAYTAGVNAYLTGVNVLPPEFLALGYRPEQWREVDSILVSLNIFKLLNGNISEERMLTVMRQTLPHNVVEFLTPKRDRYDAGGYMQGQAEVPINAGVIPVADLARLVQQNTADWQSSIVHMADTVPGSNQWVTNKTADGRGIMANDMHLPLSVPNLWYQATLNYGEHKLAGVFLPGLPMLIAGSSEYIAWGFTNAQADVLDLVPLQINPLNHKQYQAPDGWRDLSLAQEIIKVKNAQDVEITVRNTHWGPIIEHPLDGKPVAVQWTLYHPQAVNLDLLQMDQILTVEDAIPLFNQAGLPALNVVMADRSGHIAWTLTGKFPQRHNFDGSYSVSREQGLASWLGMMPTADYPRLMNPASGFLFSANNSVIAHSEAFPVGHNFAHGYRASRIAALLSRSENVDEADMHRMQLDTKVEFYEFYRQLALDLLAPKLVAEDQSLMLAKQALLAWDGHANRKSLGFGVLVEFRAALSKIVLSAYLQPSYDYDSNFSYRWMKMDEPLRLLLTHKIPQILPGSQYVNNWNELILTVLRQVVANINQQHPHRTIATLTWGDMHKTRLKHPFSHGMPWLSGLLDMPDYPLAGCHYCIRAASPSFGASMRLVFSPGQEDKALLVTPTGQSGHPWSAHYHDKFQYWVNGKALALKQPLNRAQLHLRPSMATQH